MPSQPPRRNPVILRPAARGRTVVVRRQRAAQGRGGLIIGFLLAGGVFGLLLAALAMNHGERQPDSGPHKAAAPGESHVAYDHMLAEIVSRIRTSQTVGVLNANRVTFHQQIDDSTSLTETQKQSLRGEIMREVEARKNAMTRASYQR